MAPAMELKAEAIHKQCRFYVKIAYFKFLNCLKFSPIKYPN